MTGMTTIIAIIALFAGLVAIWLITETAKKIEIRTQKMIEIHIRGLRQSVVDLGKVVTDQKAGQEALVNRVRDVVRNREAADVQLASLRKEIDAITRVLDQTTRRSKKSGSSVSHTGRK